MAKPKTGPNNPASQPAASGDVAGVAPVDLDSPEAVAERRWSAVLKQWREGDPTPMAEWLRTHALALPEDAREFLAAHVLGQVQRPRGRPARRAPALERQILAEVYAARESLARRPSVMTPHERAIERVAERRRMSPGAVRGVVDRLSAAGLTFEAWQQWGRPTFADPTQSPRTSVAPR
jgi:hypothetical protein